VTKIFVSTVPFGNINDKPLKLLEKTGWEVEMNPLNRKLSANEISDYAKDFDGIIAGTEDLRDLIKRSKSLKIISRVGIGLDSVPLSECRRKGITVTYTPNAVTPSVAELIVGIMISLTRHVCLADKGTRQNMWDRLIGKRIGKSIIGLIGFGRIGSSVAKLLVPFNPSLVLINDIKDKEKETEELREVGLNVMQVEKHKIYQKADIVSLHLPLYSKTYNLINEKTLNLFKKDSFLLNFSRGGIVNEKELYKVLKNDLIQGAAIDVFEKEPYSGELCHLKNVILTQHMGSCSFDCRYEMELQATEDIIRYFRKEALQNEVPPEEYDYQLA